MHRQRVIVWYGFWAGGIIELFFFENAAGCAVTVYGARYGAMIIRFFGPKWQDIDEENIWFQQDGATYHTVRETPHHKWPPRLGDLTALDVILWIFFEDSSLFMPTSAQPPTLRRKLSAVSTKFRHTHAKWS